MSTSTLKPRMFIVSAPSGAGKSSLCARALAEFPELVDTVTYTTRAMRDGESEGHPYHFVNENRFVELREQGFFVEWAIVHGKLYGTPKYQLEDAWKQGKWIIMDVDVQGAATFKKLYPDAVSIFIVPPSLDELRRRIVSRDKGKTPDLEIRLKNAEHELKEASKFDYKIVNDVFELSYNEFKKLIAHFVKSR
jgi:guanylate kinase